jgi:hypothetical protein
MQIKKDFTIQKIGSSYVAVPVGETSKSFHAMINLNETGAFIWNQLAEADRTVGELVELMTAEYAVDAKRAEKDVVAFTDNLRKAGLLDE